MNEPMELYGKLARLYTSADLKPGTAIALDEQQTHYLKNVLRKNPGDSVRFFNGANGEWLADLQDLKKKSGTATLTKQIRAQPKARPALHLLFAPIKKQRLDFLIEKSVELGVTDLHPAITARTENRNLNEDRLRAQIIEAAEQCERMTVPNLHTAAPLDKKIAAWDKSITLYACLERSDAPHISTLKSPQAFLIGPEGGFDERETGILSSQQSVKPISLGETVYRAETAAILCLASTVATQTS